MILTLLLWKVKGYHYFIEAVLTIASKTKHDVVTIVSKDTFLNHREKKERMFSRSYFSIFTADKLLKGYHVYIWGKNFCLQT